jgi:hypothetical protein
MIDVQCVGRALRLDTLSVLDIATRQHGRIRPSFEGSLLQLSAMYAGLSLDSQPAAGNRAYLPFSLMQVPF